MGKVWMTSPMALSLTIRIFSGERRSPLSRPPQIFQNPLDRLPEARHNGGGAPARNVAAKGVLLLSVSRKNQDAFRPHPPAAFQVGLAIPHAVRPLQVEAQLRGRPQNQAGSRLAAIAGATVGSPFPPWGDGGKSRWHREKPLRPATAATAPVDFLEPLFRKKAPGDPGLVGNHHGLDPALIQQPDGFSRPGNQTDLRGRTQVSDLFADRSVPVQEYRNDFLADRSWEKCLDLASMPARRHSRVLWPPRIPRPR